MITRYYKALFDRANIHPNVSLGYLPDWDVKTTSHKEAKMKSLSNQVHVYEHRQARWHAYRLATMVERSAWGITAEIPFELSVKESNRKDIEGGDHDAETTFTFRFEGGTVVRIEMRGTDDRNYGFQWSPMSAEVRYYESSTDSQYPILASPKKSVRFEREFFWGEKWWLGEMPTA